jgi:hypothetical protein
MLLAWLREWAENYIDRLFIFLADLLQPESETKNAELTGKIWSKHWQKPLWSCVICMSGLWTIILTWSLNIPLIFLVCGINVLIDKIINYEGAAGG